MAKIYVRRGDTEEIKVTFYKGWEKYTPEDLKEGDLFSFTVRDKFNKEVVIEKKVAYPNTTFKINHEDTKDLITKTYEYDVEYRKPDNSVVKTLIYGDFIIGLDVTYGDEK